MVSRPSWVAGGAEPSGQLGMTIVFYGAIGCHPVTHELSATVEEEVRLIFRHLEVAFGVHGATLQDIVHMTLCFTDRKAHWLIFDKVRRSRSASAPPSWPPARAIEIDALAAAPD